MKSFTSRNATPDRYSPHAKSPVSPQFIQIDQSSMPSIGSPSSHRVSEFSDTPQSSLESLPSLIDLEADLNGTHLAGEGHSQKSTLPNMTASPYLVYPLARPSPPSSDINRAGRYQKSCLFASQFDGPRSSSYSSTNRRMEGTLLKTRRGSLTMIMTSSESDDISDVGQPPAVRTAISDEAIWQRADNQDAERSELLAACKVTKNEARWLSPGSAASTKPRYFCRFQYGIYLYDGIKRICDCEESEGKCNPACLVSRRERTHAKQMFELASTQGRRHYGALLMLARIHAEDCREAWRRCFSRNRVPRDQETMSIELEDPNRLRRLLDRNYHIKHIALIADSILFEFEGESYLRAHAAHESQWERFNANTRYTKPFGQYHSHVEYVEHTGKVLHHLIEEHTVLCEHFCIKACTHTKSLATVSRLAEVIKRITEMGYSDNGKIQDQTMSPQRNAKTSNQKSVIRAMAQLFGFRRRPTTEQPVNAHQEDLASAEYSSDSH